MVRSIETDLRVINQCSATETRTKYAAQIRAASGLIGSVKNQSQRRAVQASKSPVPAKASKRSTRKVEIVKISSPKRNRMALTRRKKIRTTNMVTAERIEKGSLVRDRVIQATVPWLRF